MQNRSSSISDIAKELQFPRTTVRDVVKTFISTGSIERKKESGGNRFKIDKKFTAKILADYKRKPSVCS